MHIYIWNAICSIPWSELVSRCTPSNLIQEVAWESIWLLAFLWPHQHLGSGPESGSRLGMSITPNRLRLDLKYDLTFLAVTEGRRKGQGIFFVVFQ